MNISKKVKDLLLEKYEGEFERVGFILPDDGIVEVENICSKPEGGFDVSGEDLITYIDVAIGTWHTHPNATSNLSVGDYLSFLNYADFRHLIVGNDGVTEYYVEDGEVLIAS